MKNGPLHARGVPPEDWTSYIYLMNVKVLSFLIFFYGMAFQLKSQSKNLTYTLRNGIPLTLDLEFELNGIGQSYTHHDERILITMDHDTVVLTNLSQDTLHIKNILPFSKKQSSAYITGLGNHSLSRAHLFLPNHSPVNIILPDDSWELGFNSFQSGDQNFYALSRRCAWEHAQRSRFETGLFAGGKVKYVIYADTFQGTWQDGLRKCFNQNKVYDIKNFNDEMYRRTDLSWIRHSYMMHLIMAWDDKLYDRKKNRYKIEPFLQKANQEYGGDDVIGIWPTWPALGLDQRNQWDMYRDLPGSLKGLRQLSDQCHRNGTKFFIAYNPWDESTRTEDHLQGMAELVKAIDADGVVLDTRGSSSKEMQAAVDKVRPGVILYSEGMAVPKDMESIISGRVHNALYFPPILNLNKVIKPDFGIFRVAEVFKEPIHREIYTSLFNGYGIEYNIFHPGDPNWLDEQNKLLGKALMILRENDLCFKDSTWVPLYPSLKDRALINKWKGQGHKELYTIYNSDPAGFEGNLFISLKKENTHWVNLWNHEEIELRNDSVVTALDPFPQKYLGTNNEGSMNVLARFDSLLTVKKGDLDNVWIHANAGTHYIIYAGKPSYPTPHVKFSLDMNRFKLHSIFPDHDGDFTVQLFDDKELIDERIISFGSGTPYAVSEVHPIRDPSVDTKMKWIRGGSFNWKTEYGDDFIPYPQNGKGDTIHVHSFYIDPHPVTNREYSDFIKASHYIPKDKTNYLKHWVHGKINKGDENKPVIYVSAEDAQAYSNWSHKRLPTEIEWQYAAQTDKLNIWPWGPEAGISHIHKEVVTETLTHITFDSFDSTLANPGNGTLDAIGHYPKGINPHGLSDLVGSIWQMTNDVYRTGSYTYRIIKGGSYYKPSSSWWYVSGGPKPLTWRQMWLQIHEGFERNGTVGFRCVRDE